MRIALEGGVTMPASKIFWTIYLFCVPVAAIPLAYLDFTNSDAQRTGLVGWVSDWSSWIMLFLCLPGVVHGFVRYVIKKEEVRLRWPWE